MVTKDLKQEHKYGTKGTQMCKWVDPNEGAYICYSFSGDWLTSAPGFAKPEPYIQRKCFCGFSIFKRKP